MNELLQTLTPIQAAKYLGISESVPGFGAHAAKARATSKPGKNWYVTAAPILTPGLKPA